MKILITDSKGDSISITIGQNGLFSELKNQEEKQQKAQIDCVQNETQTSTTETESQNEFRHQDSAKESTNMHNFKVEASKKELQGQPCKIQIPLKIEPSPQITGDVEPQKNPSNIKMNIKSKDGVDDIEEIVISEDEELHGNQTTKLLQKEPDSTREIHLQSVCRLCASRATNLVDIFGSNEMYTNVVQKINNCLPIIVRETDTLPVKACNLCLEKLEFCHRFHETVAAAEKQLLILSEATVKKLQESANHDEPAVTPQVTDDETHTTAILPPNEPKINGIKSPVNEDIELNETKMTDETLSAEESEDYKTKHSDGEDDEMDLCLDVTGSVIPLARRIQNSVRSLLPRSISPTESIDSDEDIGPLPQYKCHECKLTFDTDVRLQFHRACHESSSTTGFCGKCKLIMDSETSLFHHVLIVHGEEDDYTCHLCGKQYNTQEQLNEHQLNHRVEPSYKCETCNEVFNCKNKLEIHKKTHAAAGSSVSCIFCGQQFEERSELIPHIRSHTKRRFYNCDLCDKTYTHNSHLVRHRKTHKSDHPYKCYVCDKTFSSSANLLEHGASHTEIDPYTCSICKKTFKKANGRRSHMRIHTDEKKHECAVCGTKFLRACHMYKHIRTQHPDRKNLLPKKKKAKI